MICMEGLSHRDTLPPPPPVGGGGGCSRIAFALYCCYIRVWIGAVCMYACMYEWMDAGMYVYHVCIHAYHKCI